MSSSVLRKSGGSLIITVPQSFVVQNRLRAGSRVEIEIAGPELTIRRERSRPRLTDLLVATPRGRHRAPGWDEMPPAGKEK